MHSKHRIAATLVRGLMADIIAKWLFPATFSMAGTLAHWDAIRSGNLLTVQAFLQAHPDALNRVRSPLPSPLSGMGKEKEEEEEEKERKKRRRRGTHHNGDAFSL